VATRNATVGDIFGFSQIKGEVGVEVEVEASNVIPSQDYFKSYWQRMHDGSLRGNDTAEFIFIEPKTEEVSYRAINYLSKRLKDFNTNVLDSVRAGVHVHINVREMNLTQLWTFVTCYYVLEELLTDWCGDGRQGNHFCLRAKDAEFVIHKVVHIIRNNDLGEFNAESVRYAALNFNSLRKFGTLEFRALRTPQDFSKINSWVKTLLNIKRNSHLFTNPRSVVENFSINGEETFLNAVLGDEAKLFGNDRMILRGGVRIAQEIAYAKEWDDGHK